MALIDDIRNMTTEQYAALQDNIHRVRQQLDRIEEKLPKPAEPETPSWVRTDHDTACDVFYAIKDRKKIEAIKALRTLTGLGLKEAKDLIEIIWDHLKEE